MKDVHEKFHKDILVPMTLLRKESYCIIEKLNREGIDTRLVVLEAGYQTVHTVSWPAARRRSAGAWRTSSWRVKAAPRCPESISRRMEEPWRNCAMKC